MVTVAIDLSLRSSGLCYNDTDTGTIIFKLISTDPKKYNDELLLMHMTEEIMLFIDGCPKVPDRIVLEGLSFGSVSSSKDIIAGNFWFLRVALFRRFGAINIVPVTSWRSPLFTKEDRKDHKICTAMVKDIKRNSKNMNTEEKKKYMAEHAITILGSDIKYLTYLKLPELVRKQIDGVVSNQSRYDLTDAYFLSTWKNK